MLERPIRAAEEAAPLDPDSAMRDAIFAWIDEHLWTFAYGFVGGCFFTAGSAWAWSWFL